MKHNLLARALSVLFVLAIIASCFAVNTFAVSSVNCQPTNKYGGASKYFYVKASGSTSKLKFTCGTGNLDYGGVGTAIGVRGAYEIKIYKWDKGAGKITGSCIYDKDIYNKSSVTISFSSTKNCYYRVQVYFWNATTTATSYFKNRVIRSQYRGDAVGVIRTPCWDKLPTITAANASGCTLYTSKP